MTPFILPVVYSTNFDIRDVFSCGHAVYHRIILCLGYLPVWCLTIVFYPRKFKGGICCGGHLAVTYGDELFYLRIFSLLSPPNNSVKRELPLPRGLKSRTQTGYPAVNHAITIMCADRAKSEGTIIHLHTWRLPPHSLNIDHKETQFPLLNSLILPQIMFQLD